MHVMVSSVASDIFEWNNNHTDTDRSLIHVLKINTSASLTFFFFVFFFLPVHTAFCTFPQRTGFKERCPKECVYKLPVNTRTQALMHSHTRTQTVYIPVFPLCRRFRQYAEHAPSYQPRRGTFGSSFSGKNKKEKQTKKKRNSNLGCYLFLLL